MRIAFYAPLKAPDHPVPSGDRQMGRLLMAALERAGHKAEVASTLRAFMAEPSSAVFSELAQRAKGEVERLAGEWRSYGPPDLWFSYHPYYKAPDLMGPALCGHFGIPYVTCEASYAEKRDLDGWAPSQREVVHAVNMAAVNLCFTKRDRDGLARGAPGAVFVDVKPFIDTGRFASEPARSQKQRLVTVAMMRRGDKFRSFTMLAEALELIRDVPWELNIAGDGPMRAQVQQLFARFDQGRITWAGEVAAEHVAGLLYDADMYVWPGCGEAYGLAYLEAQAAGLPVIAQNTAGIPEVLRDNETALLTPEGDVAAYAAAIRRLLGDDAQRIRMSRAARRFVLEERSLEAAAMRLGSTLGSWLSR